MNVTSSIWGAPESWSEVTEYNKPLGKVATFAENAHTLASAVTNNKLVFNEPITDYSLSWCALGQESYYTDMHLYVNNADTGVISTPEPLNFFMYYINGGSGHQDYAPSTSNYKNVLYNGYDPGQEWGNLNANRYIQPFTDFYIKKCVWRVQVDCVDTLSNSTISTYDFNDYYNNRTVSHPYILHVYATPYFGEAGARSPVTTNMTVGSCLAVAPFIKSNMYGANPDYQDFALSSTDRKAQITLFGSLAQNITGTSSYIFTLGKCLRQTTSPRRTYQTGTSTELKAILDRALQTIACFGFYFVLDGDTHIQDELDSEYIYMGVIPSDGITHGEYTHGAANRNNLNWSWESSKDSTYDWTKPVTNYDNNSPFNSLSIAAFNKMYAIQKQTAGKLAKVLSNGILSRPSGTPIDEWLNDTFLTSNPLDTIVSLKKFPMSVLSGADFTAEKIYFGAYSDDNITGIPYTLNPPYRIYTTTFTGENMFKPEFGDSFLDYEPFTNVSLYLPFCGTVKIPVAEFMGHDINITYTIDLISGSVAAYVRRDNLNILSAQGTCAIDIPVSGIQGATLDSQIFQSSQNLRAAKSNEVFAKTAAFGSALNVAQSKSYTGVLSTIGSEGRRLENATLARQGAEYELSHIELPLKQVGGASPLTSQLAEFNCRLIIERPVLSPDYDPEVYADTVGFACLINGKVSDFTGLTEASINLDSVNCTADEKKMIASAFANGVYL